eukprot:scaffold677_cov77-Skeletonema_dohrnii-CCMP3373.AAC.3
MKFSLVILSASISPTWGNLFQHKLKIKKSKSSKTASPSFMPSLTPSSSGQPSSEPSLVPSESSQPSSMPSGAPSASGQPSSAPSGAPSASGQPSGTPSGAPSASGEPSGAPSSTRDKLMKSLLLTVSSEAALDNKDSPQGKASLWVTTSPLQLQPGEDDDQIIQQYILAVFYYATGGAGWNDKEGWLESSNECTWDRVDCSGSGVVTKLLHLKNNLVGSIPTELGKLDGLEELELRHNKLSDSIPTELGELGRLDETTISTVVSEKRSSKGSRRIGIGERKRNDVRQGRGDLIRIRCKIEMNAAQLRASSNVLSSHIQQAVVFSAA